MPTEKKREMVAFLRDQLAKSQLVVLTDYRGLNVAALTGLRRSLEKTGARYHVVKNTLLKIALQEEGITGLEPYLEGPTAVAFAHEDPVAVARVLTAQQMELPALQVKGGWMPGQVLAPDRIQFLATLPPRPVLLGQLLGAVQGPLASLAGGLSEALRQLVYLLQKRSEGQAEAV
ncbi:MAG: 50S ribosomal protein L10 [Chloroflexia bacterium]